MFTFPRVESLHTKKDSCQPAQTKRAAGIILISPAQLWIQRSLAQLANEASIVVL
jgi:hypothetical protein